MNRARVYSNQLVSNKSNEIFVFLKSVAFRLHLQAFPIECFILNSGFFVVSWMVLPIFPPFCGRKLT